MVDEPDAPTGRPSLPDRLGSLFKTSAKTPVNISAAARSLGVSRDTVRRMLGGAHSPRGESALERAEKTERRRPQWIDGAHEGAVAHRLFPEGMPQLPGERDVPGMIEMVAARKPDGSVNITRTAKDLGVSARSLARWLKGEARPRALHQEQLRNEVRATALSQSDAAMQATITGMVMNLRFTAIVSDDKRRRRTTVRFGPDQVNAAHLAWLNGGDEGLSQWLENDLVENYFYTEYGVSEDTDVQVSDVSG